MTIRVEILEADAVTPVDAVDFENVVDGEVQDMVSGDSVGALSVGLESAQRGALAVEGRVLRWKQDGTARFWSLIEANDQVSLTESKSRVPRQISVRGRGLVAQWEAARVQQWPGMARTPYYTRHFNYASPGKAAEIDGTAYEHGPVMDYDANGQPNQPDRPPPVTWRAPSAQRIYSAAFNLDEPDGTSLFRTTFTTGTDALILRQHGTADDQILAWVGGVPVLKGPDKPSVTWFDTWPSATLLEPETTYEVVVRCENEYTAPGGSAAWLGMAGWLLETDGSPLQPSSLAYVSDSSWTALRPLTDPTPGWTPPEILDVLLDEWQPAHLTGWEVVDMAASVGAEWVVSQETNFETRRTTGLDVLRQFENGLAEFSAEVVGSAKRLLCFPFGTMGDFHTTPTPPVPTDAELMALSFRWVKP